MMWREIWSCYVPGKICRCGVIHPGATIGSGQSMPLRCVCGAALSRIEWTAILQVAERLGLVFCAYRYRYEPGISLKEWQRRLERQIAYNERQVT